MKVGYARVSTDDQKLELQLLPRLATTAATRSSRRKSPVPALACRHARSYAYARGGDYIVVYKLEVVTRLGERGVGLCSLRESIDTTTAAGRVTLHVFAALAEFEADVVRERTCAGLEAARRRGTRLGRPAALSLEQLEMARTLMENPRLSARQIAAQLGLHRHCI